MRIGPQMRRAASIVSHNPGCSKLFVAQQLCPRSPTNYGYRPINRAIRAGLIEATAGRGNSYFLTTAP